MVSHPPLNHNKLHSLFQNPTLIEFAWSELLEQDKSVSAQELAEILQSMGLAKMTSSAVNLLIDIGYFPVHVNFDLMKLNIHTDHSEEIISAAEHLLSHSTAHDKIDRKDLTHLKVYAIDVHEADEVTFHCYMSEIADLANLVQPGSKIDREAIRRGTSVFLPTATYQMIPERLAMDGMSLKEGKHCNVVYVSVVLHWMEGVVALLNVQWKTLSLNQPIC